MNRVNQKVIIKAKKQICSFAKLRCMIFAVLVCAHSAYANTQQSLSEDEIQTLESFIQDAPYLQIEDNSTSSDNDIFHVVDNKNKKPGSAIARLFKRIGDGLIGKPVGFKATSKQQTAQQRTQKTVDDLIPQNDKATFQEVLDVQTMGFRAGIVEDSGFRVMRKNHKDDVFDNHSVRHDWQDFSEILGAEHAFSLHNGISGINDNSHADSYNLHQSARFRIDLYSLDQLAQLDNEFSGSASDANEITQSSPNLVLNWHAGPGGKKGLYSLSAVGRKLISQGYHEGEYVANETYGWGLNLSGGWRFGGLNAGISLAMGEGVDSLLLPLSSDDVYVHGNTIDKTQVVSVVPSLRYFFSNNSQFQVALGRYKNTSEMIEKNDTLDTIHVGYSWNAWNDSLLGVEFVEQKVDGEIGGLETDQQIRFGILRKF